MKSLTALHAASIVPVWQLIFPPSPHTPPHPFMYQRSNTARHLCSVAACTVAEEDEEAQGTLTCHPHPTPTPPLHDLRTHASKNVHFTSTVFGPLAHTCMSNSNLIETEVSLASQSMEVFSTCSRILEFRRASVSSSFVARLVTSTYSFQVCSLSVQPLSRRGVFLAGHKSRMKQQFCILHRTSVAVSSAFGLLALPKAYTVHM